MENIERYSKILQNPHMVFLVPIENSPFNFKEVDTDYIIYGRAPLGIAIVSVDNEDMKSLSEKLIELGVEIKDKLPYYDDTFDELVQHLWTDEASDYVLIQRKSSKYRIHNKVLNQSIQLKFKDPNRYDEVIQNMIEAGVEIWDKLPDEE